MYHLAYKFGTLVSLCFQTNKNVPPIHTMINSEIYNLIMQGIVGLETNLGTIRIQVSALCLYNKATIF